MSSNPLYTASELLSSRFLLQTSRKIRMIRMILRFRWIRNLNQGLIPNPVLIRKFLWFQKNFTLSSL